MEIKWFKHLPSTHKYLIESIKNQSIVAPLAVGVDFQSDGVGSRGNSWQGEEGNLYFSFCVKEEHLPKDLKLESISIYFSFLMKEVLAELDSDIWIKWPNDFYIKNTKAGGVITTKVKDTIIGSIGINILHAPAQFATLDVQIVPKKLVELFIKKLKEKISWKNVFSKYKIEFQNSLGFTFHLEGKKLSLSDAKLLDDGSIEIENKRVYSLR
ncbi:biotin--[acetyl-CoA-carboxylase] ligase [Sulfurospirillum arcachonense]|uniref:biotin--[acetyl-CoA-carboxylase] ligase n=1 Tax=Sulfurospirillum arcachonense TaxID=57666 RepID=UPI000468E423|nr:biotin--[acetyl-CoA-carboxylase] ligase [Sulfurospirillum arcachonense]